MDIEKKWWHSAVVYQIYPRSFMDSNGDGIGDIGGIISRLGYLKDLGVDVIWISPIYESPNVDGGYDISDYRAIAPEFGTMEDFERLLKEAHALGLKIVMDLVVNHTSDKHAWFIESRSSTDNPKRDWYYWRDGVNGSPPNELRSFFSGSAWERDDTTGQYYLHLFAKGQPDLNWENKDVRAAVFDMMRWWLDKGVDGFRMDVINMISKRPETFASLAGLTEHPSINGPRVVEFLREMGNGVISHYDIMTVGETAQVTPNHAKMYAGTTAGLLNMIFQFELNDVDRGDRGKWSLNRWKLCDIKRVLGKWQTQLNGAAWNSLYWSNHDQPRTVSRFGDTSSDVLRVKSAKMLGTCLHMMQGTPYIYQGEELGMTNVLTESLDDLRDVESLNAYNELVREQGVFTHETMMEMIRKVGRDNARTPMQWDLTANAGFTTGKPWINVNSNYTEINAASQTGDDDSIYSYYKRLTRCRKTHPVIIYGDYTPLLEDDTRLFAYTRAYMDEELLVICNFTNEAVNVGEGFFSRFEGGERLIGNGGADAFCETIEPYEARVLVRK